MRKGGGVVRDGGGAGAPVLSVGHAKLLVMPRICEFDDRALADLLKRQHGVIARAQALGCGLSAEGVRYQIRDGGPWRRLLPGVYLAHTGSPSNDQREMAALLYTGPGGVLTGAAALRRFGLTGPRTDLIDVLVPATAQRREAGFVRIRRTKRLPETVGVAGEVRYAFPPRAVADAARGLADLGEVRAVVAGAVQRGKCPIGALRYELDTGPRRGSALLRRALAEVADGVRSAAEADLHAVIKRARLPMPMFNPRLFAGQVFLASPDCWWPDAGVAAEVDSREWHLSPRDWEETLARHARMSAHGIIALHFTPGQIYTKRNEVVTVIRSAIAAGRSRPLPRIRALAAN
jgi:hypothetical protein